MSNTSLKVRLKWDWGFFNNAQPPWIKISVTPKGKTDEVTLIDWQKATTDATPTGTKDTLSVEGSFAALSGKQTIGNAKGSLLIGLSTDYQAGATFHKWIVLFKEKAETAEDAEKLAQASPKKHEANLGTKGMATQVDAATEKAKRDAMIALFDYWLKEETTMFKPYLPTKADGTKEEKDLLALANWVVDKPEKLTWTIPGNERLGVKATATLNVFKGAKWTQTGATIECNGEGNRSAAKKSWNETLMAAWTAKSQAKDPDAGKAPSLASGETVPIDTSCLSVMAALMRLWGSQFQIDTNTMVNGDSAWYVSAAEAFKDQANPILPKPGDILFLCIGDSVSGTFGHTCFFVSAESDAWNTCDGGGGMIPDQSARKVRKPLTWTTKGPRVPIIASTTDNHPKALHGWVDLSKVQNDKYK